MKNDFNLCPKCGSKNIINHGNRKWVCQDCDFDLYNNVAAAVGVIIMDKFNNILLEIRAKEPRKGYLALPGGFVDFDERAEDAVLRECREEIGVEVKNARFLCSFPNTYEYKNIEYKTCDLFFTAELSDEFSCMEDFIKSLKAEESEVQGFKICKVETMEDIESIPLAFESARKTLRFMMESK